MHRFDHAAPFVRRMAAHRSALGSVILAALICAPAAPAAAQAYKIRNLGSLSGFAESHGYGINKSGQVAGEAHVPGGKSHAFVWLPSSAYGLPAGLSDLDSTTDGSMAAYGLNDSGQTIINAWAGSFFGGQAFLWLPASAYGLPAGMNSLAGLGDETAVLDINNSGSVVGYSYVPGRSNFRACLWTNGSLIDIDPSGVETTAQGINEGGMMVGARHSLTGAWWQAVAWNGGTMSILPDLGGSESWASDLNDANQIVGTSSLSGDTQYRGTLWLPTAAYGRAAGLHNIGTLTGLRYCVAYGINTAGVIVGWAGNSWSSYSPDGRAIIWSPGGVRRADLNSMIPAGSGWTLRYASKVTDSGQIVGAGTYGGSTRAFVLTPINLAGFSISTATVAGSKPLTGTVTLSANAPAGGVVVALSSNNPAGIVPASVTVPAGAIKASFTIKTAAVSTARTATFTATLGLQTKTAALRVRPISVGSLTISPDELVGGETATGIVVLECPAAPGDIEVTLSSSTPGVAQPMVTSIIIPAGATTGTFTIVTGGVSSVTAVTFKATANGLYKSAPLLVYP